MTTDEFTAFMSDDVTSVDDFKSFAAHNPDGDCLEVFLSNEPFKAKPLGNGLTVYRGRESGRVAGILVESPKRTTAVIPISNDDFARHMIHLATQAALFRPSANYDPDGDCIEVVLSPEPFVGESVGNGLVVYRGQESGLVVGVLIEAVGRLTSRGSER